MKISMQQQIDKKTVGETFNEFIRYCRVKNLAEDTIVYYNDSYKSFSKFYSRDEVIGNIDLGTIHNYILYLKESHINSTSINTRIRGIRAFLYYAMKLGYHKKFTIELIKSEKQIKQVYTDDELKLLLKKPDLKKCTFNEYRNWVIVNYALGTGNRVSSIINIKIADIDFTNSYITLQKTKNKKQQVIPLSNTLANILKEYLSYRKGNEDDYLFCNAYGNQLSDRSLQASIERYNKSRGLVKTSCHLFRHTFAKKWILAGWDIFRLQKILGHSSLDIVKEYVNMFSDDLQRDFEKFNPLDQMNTQDTKVRMR